jgi:hypothetical protein
MPLLQNLLLRLFQCPFTPAAILTSTVVRPVFVLALEPWVTILVERLAFKGYGLPQGRRLVSAACLSQTR